MKAFIERVFKSKKQKQKELLDEITNTKVTDIIEENKEILRSQIETSIKEHIAEVKKEKHIDCECNECINRIKQHA